jgi:tetratricopeptide (TPR) repeat protein
MKGAPVKVNNIRNLVFVALLITLIASVSRADESDVDAESTYTESQCHKRFAIECNNKVWDLLSKESRTEQENESMLNAAHASHYHWNMIGKTINVQRGHWLISHVYAVVGKPDQALYHAKKCLSLTEEHGFIDFDLAYAYEAMARANASAGNRQEAIKYLKLARAAAEKIEAEEDRQLFSSDLEAGPWYGVE